MADQPKTPEEYAKATDEAFANFWRDLNATVQNTHAGHVLVTAAGVSELLRKALLTKMRTLTKKEHNELFVKFGPLSSFAGRIALAFALNIITAEMRDDMLTIKAIRNRFAHPPGRLDFSDPEIVALCKRLSTYNPAQTDLLTTAYVESLRRIDSHFRPLVASETTAPTDDKIKEQG